MPKARMPRRVIKKQVKAKVAEAKEQPAPLGGEAAQQVLGIVDQSVVALQSPAILREKDKEVKKNAKKTSAYKDARNQKLQKASKRNVQNITKTKNYKVVQ